VRKPFSWRGTLWVCVGKSHLNGGTATAYRLIHPQLFDGDAARADPNGFYHGMSVKHAGRTMALCGPPVTFMPGQTEQPDLFGGLCDPEER
jgi:hypothetical protein